MEENTGELKKDAGTPESIPPLRSGDEYRARISQSLERPLPLVSLTFSEFVNERTGPGIQVAIFDEHHNHIGAFTLVPRTEHNGEKRAYVGIVGLDAKYQKKGYARSAYASLIPQLAEQGVRLSSSSFRNRQTEAIWQWLIDAGVARQRPDRIWMYEVI